jgi:hypothetical protein
MVMTQSAGGNRQARHQRDLEARVDLLERQVATLAAGLDAASRMRLSTRSGIGHDLRIAGGRVVRRILEQGGLVEGYPEAPGTD